MVRETLLTPAAGPQDASDARVRTSLGEVAPRERFDRHGHRAGVLLLGNRPSLVRSLERALFQEGFEVVVVDGSEVASPVLVGFLTSLFSAGLVVLCANAALAPQDLAGFPREDIFQATATLGAVNPDVETDDAQIIEKAVSFAEKLRLSSRHPDGKEF